MGFLAGMMGAGGAGAAGAGAAGAGTAAGTAAGSSALGSAATSAAGSKALGSALDKPSAPSGLSAKTGDTTSGRGFDIGQIKQFMPSGGGSYQSPSYGAYQPMPMSSPQDQSSNFSQLMEYLKTQGR